MPAKTRKAPLEYAVRVNLKALLKEVPRLVQKTSLVMPKFAEVVDLFLPEMLNKSARAYEGYSKPAYVALKESGVFLGHLHCPHCGETLTSLDFERWKGQRRSRVMFGKDDAFKHALMAHDSLIIFVDDLTGWGVEGSYSSDSLMIYYGSGKFRELRACAGDLDEPNGSKTSASRVVSLDSACSTILSRGLLRDRKPGDLLTLIEKAFEIQTREEESDD